MILPIPVIKHIEVMIMNIYENNQIRNDLSFLDILFHHYKNKKTVTTKQSMLVDRDMLTLSQEALEMSAVKGSSGRSLNTKVDSSIDLQSYIDAARKSNQEALEQAGDSIDVNAVVYTSESKAFRAALRDKYSRLVEEAKTHSDPESYIERKYFDKSFEYYETDLTDAERSVGYVNEKTMYEKGDVFGINYQDSLFRGIEVKGYVVNSTKIAFQRQLVNHQITNILSQAGIDTNAISGSCSFSVDPYSYQITVSGVDGNTKAAMEQALNVGDNGKNLYLHIYYCSTQDGCSSTQVNKASKLKYEAYQQVYDFTGLKLNELTESNGTYYTAEGEDILDLVNAGVNEADEITGSFKMQIKSWIRDLVHNLSVKGWNHVSDMTLSILFTANGLEDVNQVISFAENSSWYQSTIGDSWYAAFQIQYESKQ